MFENVSKTDVFKIQCYIFMENVYVTFNFLLNLR
jgi:hypothetical protein